MEVATRLKSSYNGGLHHEFPGGHSTTPKPGAPEVEESHEAYPAMRLKEPSHGLDPFSLLPPLIDQWQETMLEFYLKDGESYGATSGRMFKSTMKPWPREERFQVALSLPSMLYSTLARATFHYLRQQQDLSTAKRFELQQCGAKLRSEALRLLRKTLVQETHSKAELGGILAMTTSLATLEQMHGPPEVARMHQRAAQRVLTCIGEPETNSHEKSLLWYECILAPGTHSFIWDPHTMEKRVAKLNVLLAEISQCWERDLLRKEYKIFRSTIGLRASPFPDPGSRLYRLLSRSSDQFNSVGDPSDRRSRLFCVLLYAESMSDLHNSPHTSYTYKSKIEKLLEIKDLDESTATVNLAWLMCADVGVVLADDAGRRWEVAAMINVIKFMNEAYQHSIINWTLRFIQGASFQHSMRVNSYAFSYAAIPPEQYLVTDDAQIKQESLVNGG